MKKIFRILILISLSLLIFLLNLFLFRDGKEFKYEDLHAFNTSQIKEVKSPKPQLAFAFGGGGVRGFIHIGVIKALDEAGIRADIVTGSSAGSIIAALYAAGISANEIEKLALTISPLQIVGLSFSNRGILSGEKLANFIDSSLSKFANLEKKVEKMPIALGITVSELDSGSSLLIRSGKIGEAVQASCAIPGSFIPIKNKGKTWVDGAFFDIVPVKFAQAMGAEMVIGIDIYCGNFPLLLPKGRLNRLLQVIRRETCLIGNQQFAAADILIRPQFEPKNMVGFSERKDAIEAGYLATKAKIAEIKEKMRAKGF